MRRRKDPLRMPLRCRMGLHDWQVHRWAHMAATVHYCRRCPATRVFEPSTGKYVHHHNRTRMGRW